MFKDQILEDIGIIKKEYSTANPLLEKDDYAFNYWVLSRLFNLDEEILDDYITEYRDDGVDCFVFFEDSKELYIIQNKFYSDETSLLRSYVQNEFLNKPLTTLANNRYNRSEKLQKIFNKYKNDPDLNIYLHLYISNNKKDQTIIGMVNRYQKSVLSIAGYVTAQIFYLDDIEKLYFGERKEETKTFVGSFYSINEGTILNINKDAYHLPNLIEAKYLLMPVVKVYELVKKAKENDYSLFADNIRDYLGKNKVNTKIRTTLNSAEDRANFFYYNNGITVICDSISKSSATDPIYSKRIDAMNPQIVNGCQTVNTIFEVLDNYSKEELDRDFSQTFVMVKMLQLDSNNEDHKELYEAIVMYNNSQTAISEKQFAANISLFKDLQFEFEKRGFLLAVKQSDKNTFKNNKKFNDYRAKISGYSELFGLNIKSINDIIIPLEKLLQVILAFSKDGYYAYTKKADLLKQTSHVYGDITAYLKSNYLTVDNLLCIYLLYLKAERDKKSSEDKRTPIPLYLIGFLGRKMKNCEEKNRKDAISFLFGSEADLNNIYSYFKYATSVYKDDFKDQRGIEYNQMVKTPIDEDILSKALNKAMNTTKIFSPTSINALNKLDELLK